MSHFNFGNFLVDESNQEAFQICQDVADLVPVSPLPVLIVGDEGCGKSHLLYSIVNRVRAGTAKTGLALVTANAFPDQVRSLIGDPSPVAKAKSAILLIDQIDQFRENVEQLEGVVNIFLDHGHCVVAASSVHPGRLRNLPDGLRHIVESGSVVTIKANQSTPQIDLIRQQIRNEHQDELERAQKEIDELRILLKEATGGEAKEANPAEAAELKVLTDQLRNALAEAEEARSNAENELANATTERDTLMLRETEALAEAEAKHQAELSPLRERLSETETRLSELEVQLEVSTSELNEAIAERDRLQEQVASLQSDMENVSKSDDTLKTELDTLRSQLAASEEARETERDRLVAEHADSYATTQDELTALRSDHTRLQEDMEALREAKEDEVSGMRSELERLQAERSQLDDETGRKSDEHARELQSLQDQLIAQTEELERLRPMADEIESLRARVEEHAAEVDRLRAAAEESESLRAQAEEVDALRSELAVAQERRAEEAQQLAEERESLAQELGEVRLDHDRLLQRLTDAESSAQAVAQERDEAVAAREAAQAAQEEALARAEHVLDQVEANRVRMGEVSAQQQSRIAELEQRLASVQEEESGAAETVAELEARLVQTQHTAEERGQALEALKEQMQSLEEALEEARTRRDTDVDASRKEAGDALEELDRVQRQYDESRSALELAQHRVRSLEGDLSALQAEAAAQVARANTQAGETESRLARILSAFETASAENKALREELGEPNGSAENSAERLMQLAQRLGSSEPSRVARAINPDAPDDSVDISI